MKKTLQSVEEQTLKTGFEHVIVDGGSIDESQKYIRNYIKRKKNVKWLSEVDNGIYNAMNKGLALSSGDMVAFLNSGDVLTSPSILLELSKITAEFTSFDVIYGDLEIVTLEGSLLRKWNSGHYSWLKVLTGWMPPHPMTIIRKEIMNKVDGFNEDFQIAADYDLLLKVFRYGKIKIKYFPKVTVKMESGGLSNGSIKSMFKANFEVLRAWRNQTVMLVPYWIFIMKPIRKIFQTVCR